jgi:hypothetical protein
MSANLSSHLHQLLQGRSPSNFWHWVLPLILPVVISACSDGSSNSTQAPVAVDEPVANEQPVDVVEPDHIEGQIIQALSAND